MCIAQLSGTRYLKEVMFKYIKRKYDTALAPTSLFWQYPPTDIPQNDDAIPGHSQVHMVATIEIASFKLCRALDSSS